MRENMNQEMRTRLLKTSARMLAEEGVKALTTRKIAAASGTSTMSVYTHFGSIQNLVNEMIKFGFEQLDIALSKISENEDPVVNLVGLTHAYLEFSRENAYLYSVMFGCINLGDLRSQERDVLKEGLYTLDRVVQTIKSIIVQKRFDPNSAFLIANQWWTIVHGFVLLETAKYLVPPNDISKVLNPLLLNFFVGLGGDKEQAKAALSVYF